MNETENGRRYAYISGPITGNSYYKAAFRQAERLLSSMGYETINPARLNEYLPKSATWEDYMKLAIASEDLCDTIYMLAGWTFSRGATEEHARALERGMNIIYQEVSGDEDS